MKSVIVTVFLLALLIAGGCENVEKQVNNNKQQEQTVITKDELSFEINFDGIEPEKHDKLKELLGHSAYIIGAVLSHNYFGDVGDQILWQNARRNELRIDYVKFHNLFDEEMSSPEDFGSTLWQIDKSYLQAINKMKVKQLDNGLQTEKEGLKEVFEGFSVFLTEDNFANYCNYSDAEDRYKRFKEYIANEFEYEKKLFDKT